MRDLLDELMDEIEPVILGFCRSCREESGEPCSVPQCAAYERVGPRMLHAVVMLKEDADLYRDANRDDVDGWRAA